MKKSFEDQLLGAVGNLCGTHIEEEEMKVSATALHTT